MRTPKEIHDKAKAVVREHGTRDPEQIALEEKIKILDVDFEQLLGVYNYRYKKRSILINSELGEHWRRLVMAHELGHDKLHRPEIKGKKCFQEFELYNLRNIYEYEANAFAAHLLLDDKEVLSLVQAGTPIDDMAKILCTHINLLIVKLTELARMGEPLQVPASPDGGFLRKVKKSELYE